MKVAIIGLGVMGKNHKRVYEKLGCEVVVIFDPVLYPKVKFNDFIERCRIENVELVSVCNPSNLHFKFAYSTLSILSKLNVLIEKPVSLEPSDYDTLKFYRDRIMVGHIERFNPGVDYLKQLIDCKSLGDIYSVKTKRVNNVPSRETIKNVATDLLVHDVDILNYLFGSQPTIINSFNGSSNGNSTIDHASLTLHYDNSKQGIRCFCEANWLSPVKERGLEMYTEMGVVKLDYFTQELTLIDTNGHKIIYNSGYTEPLINELKSFISMKKFNTRNECTIEEAFNALEIVL